MRCVISSKAQICIVQMKSHLPPASSGSLASVEQAGGDVGTMTVALLMSTEAITFEHVELSELQPSVSGLPGFL